MSRARRIICPEIPHHVTQRGNRQQDIFLDDDDRRTYLRLLAWYAPREELSVTGYCLMSNHLHLLVTPRQAESLPRALRSVHTGYAQYVNSKYTWTGHVFASRYYSCALDDMHFWAALRYVEQNPVRAGMVTRAQDWPWSSAAAHCRKTRDALLDPTPMADWPPAKWRKWLRGDDPDQDQALRIATRSGRPHGSKTFVKMIEQVLGKSLAVKPVGRPRGVKDREN